MFRVSGLIDGPIFCFFSVLHLQSNASRRFRDNECLAQCCHALFIRMNTCSAIKVMLNLISRKSCSLCPRDSPFNKRRGVCRTQSRGKNLWIITSALIYKM